MSKELSKSKEIKKYKVIDLCAGTGTFTLAFSNHLNFEIVLANDILPESKVIYQNNFPNEKFLLEDLHKVKIEDIPSHDILCAGFSCQGFSIAGKQKGFDDHRSDIFWKLLDITKFHKPKILFFENVKNLQSHNNGKTFETVKTSLEQIGYTLKWAVLDPSKISGIPQHRERIFILCFKDPKLCEKLNLSFSIKQNLPISHFLEKDIDDKYYLSKNSKIYPILEKEIIKYDCLYQYRRYYVRENKKGLCPTLTANMGLGGHNVPFLLDSRGIRKLTPRECFNFQGFDVSYKLNGISDSKLYKLAGNGICLSVLKSVIEKLVEILN